MATKKERLEKSKAALDERQEQAKFYHRTFSIGVDRANAILGVDGTNVKKIKELADVSTISINREVFLLLS